MQNNLPVNVQGPAAAPMMPQNVMYLSADEEQGIHLRDYWHIVRKRKWWCLGVFTAVVVATLLVTFLMSPIYMATSMVQIIEDNPSSVMGGSSTDPLGAITGASELDRFYETQYNILMSPTIAYGLIDTLNLKEHPTYKKMEADNPKDPPEVIRLKYGQDILDHMKVEPVKNSFLINVSFRSTDKKLAKQVPEAINNEYLKLAMSTRQQSYTMIRNWLDGELVRLGKKLELSEQTVYTDGQKSDYLGIEEGQFNVVIQKYIQTGNVLTTATSDKSAKEALLRQIQEKGADATVITSHPLIQNLRNQLISLESQVTGSGEVFGNKFPDRKVSTAQMQDLKGKLAHEVKRIETSVKADYEASSKAVALLQKEFDAAKAKVVDMENSLVQYHMLKRDLQTNTALYEALLQRMKDASVAATMVASNISVITAPELPYKPWLPRPLLFAVLSVIVGMMAGVGTAFFVEYLDSSIKSAEELEKISHLPALGVIPMADPEEDSEPYGLISYNNPGSLMSEAFFHVRTAIMLSSSDSPPQVLSITSANPEEGKTTTSMNIAVTLAGSDRRCIVIDGDVRKPKMHGTFQVPNRVGLTTYLTGNATLEEVIHPTTVPNLFFIAAGPTAPNPNELFISSKFEKLVELLRKDFDHIVIDSPPIIGFADARSLSARADGCIVVFRHHSTKKASGRLAIQLLGQNNCRILGCVLTMARKNLIGYGGYQDYYKNYKKYYKNYRKEASKSQGQISSKS